MGNIIIQNTDPTIPVEEREIIAELIGAAGPSLYDLWLGDGNTGTLEDFLNWLVDTAGITVTTMAGATYALRSLMAAVASPANGQDAYLSEGLRKGWFKFSNADLASFVTADPQQGVYVAPSAGSGIATDGSDGAWVRKIGALDPYTPEWYGAVGDGSTNDSDAFDALSDAINALDGGKIALRGGATYIVGKQTLNGTHSGYTHRWDPHKVLHFVDCAGSLTIECNGAIIKAEGGLRFGAWDAAGSPAAANSLGNASAPYIAMLYFESCTGAIAITDVELDGNIDNQLIGGAWGDTGWQISNDGILMEDCSGPRFIRNVNSHHHGRDGFQNRDHISTEHSRQVGTVINLNCHHNMRQGNSFTGGVGWTFTDCKFNETGKDLAQSSAPGAGLDIEGEGGWLCANLSFHNCEFADNIGMGMVADQGLSRNVKFYDCTFIGVTNYCCWPSNAAYRFYNCKFVGALVNAHPNADPELACQFHDCVFTDDPDLSPTGVVYVGGVGGSIIDLGGQGAENVLFNRCYFPLTSANTRLPFTLNAIYQDCTMVETWPDGSLPRGSWRGINHIDSPDCNYQGTVEAGASVFVTGGATQFCPQQCDVVFTNILAGASQTQTLAGVNLNVDDYHFLVTPEDAQQVLSLIIDVFREGGGVPAQRIRLTNTSGSTWTGRTVTFNVRPIRMIE